MDLLVINPRTSPRTFLKPNLPVTYHYKVVSDFTPRIMPQANPPVPPVMKFRSKPTYDDKGLPTALRRLPTPAEWANLRDKIAEWYQTEGLTAKNIADSLKAEGFEIRSVDYP